MDSSHKPNGKCQAGYVYNHPKTNKMKCVSSNVYYAENNNDSEILGVYLAVRAIYEEYGITNFRVFNDSVIAMSMLRADKQISKKTNKAYPILTMVRAYFKEQGITVKTEQVKRNHKLLKVCDKYSKVYRKGGNKNG